jgi:hypothetical protein
LNFILIDKLYQKEEDIWIYSYIFRNWDTSRKKKEIFIGWTYMG